MATAESPVLEAVIALANAPVLDPAHVGAAVAAHLAPLPERSNEYFEVFAGRGTASSFVEDAECRVPRGGSRAKGPLVYVTIRPAAAPTSAQVNARLGQPVGIRVPPPQAAATGSVIHVYRGKIGEVRFAFGPGPDERLLSVAIDRTE